MEKQFYRFVQRVQEENLGVEAVAVADKDRILLEHHFTPDKERNIYSHTKSYMSTAAGIAISEGKLCLEDRLADFFRRSSRKSRSRSCLKSRCAIF